MANREVALLWRCKVNGVWKRLPVRIETDVLGHKYATHDGPVDGDGHWILRSYAGRKTVYRRLEVNSGIAAFASLVAARASMRARINIPVAGAKRVNLLFAVNTAAETYVEDRTKAGKREAARDARVTLEQFMKVLPARGIPVAAVNSSMVYKFHQALRDAGMTDRTVANKHGRLMAFLRFAKHPRWKELPKQPAYEEKLPEPYSADDVRAILGVADGSLRVALMLALQCGLRDLEICHLEWGDIDWKDGVLRVQGKEKTAFRPWSFRVKDKEARDVPMPDELLNLLQERRRWGRGRETVNGPRLIVGTRQDRPNSHLLRELKRLATRQGLNCGDCDGCATLANGARDSGCYKWGLHRFRATWATRMLREGFDIRTICAWGGWSDLETAKKYLRPAAATEMRDKLNAVWQ
jgi:integrase